MAGMLHYSWLTKASGTCPPVISIADVHFVVNKALEYQSLEVLKLAVTEYGREFTMEIYEDLGMGLQDLKVGEWLPLYVARRLLCKNFHC